MKLLKYNKLHFTRRGMLVTILVALLSISANTMAIKYWNDSHDHYMAVRVTGEGFRARQMAIGGFQAGLSAIKSIPEEYLYKSGLALEPPDILLSEECKPKCMISYRLQPEDGKLNLNSLIVADTDEPNSQFRPIFERFFRNYKFSEPAAMVDSIIDWLDENNNREAFGAESEHYAALMPVMKIKNFRLFSLSEVCQIQGIEYKMIYESQAPEEWIENQKELKFLSEDEKALLQEDDWIPANNLTAYLQPGSGFVDKININAARYHVLMSLSDSMTREAVLALFKLRHRRGGYIKDVNELKLLPEFQAKRGELTLYEELVGGNNQLSGMIKTKGEIYRIVGIGSIISDAENKSSPPVIRRIGGLYDNNNKKLIYYYED